LDLRITRFKEKRENREGDNLPRCGKGFISTLFLGIKKMITDNGLVS